MIENNPKSEDEIRYKPHALMLAKHKITISLMQTSAISFVLCVEDKYNHIDELNRELQINFNSEVVKNVSLFTVRNAKLEDLNKFYENKNILFLVDYSLVRKYVPDNQL